MDYEVAFQVPADLPEGDYEVWLHSGTGGWFGWCLKPLTLSVRLPKPLPPAFKLRDYGAAGDGLTDDTPAFQKAFAAAQAADGGIVLVPPGIFAIRAPLLLPSGVQLQGAGKGNSSIRVVDSLPFKAERRDQPWPGYAADYLPSVRALNHCPMVYVSSESSVSDLEFIGGQVTNLLLESYAPDGEFHDFTLNRCQLTNPVSTIFRPGVGPASVYATGAFGGGNPWRRVRITDNVIRAESGVGTRNASWNCVIANNDFEPVCGSVSTASFSNLTGWHNLWEGNTIRNSNRGFTNNSAAEKMQGESIIARNQIVDGGPNHGAAESYLIEYGGGRTAWAGRIFQAGPDWFECSWGGPDARPSLPPEAFAEQPVNPPQARWEPDLYAREFAIIIKGKGYGQYVPVKSNTETRMTLTQPWRVVPDSSSWVVVRRCYYNSIFMNNTSRDTLGSLELWGGCLENVFYRHMTYNTAPAHMMTHSEPIVMYNRFRDCQLYNSSLAMWELGNVDQNLRVPTMVGNIFTRSRIQDGSILLVRRALAQGRGYISLDDPAVVANGPSIAYNVFWGNTINPKDDEYAIHVIDQSCLGNVFLGNTFPADRVLDNGTQTVWADNRDGKSYHFKDAYEYDVRAYQEGRTY
jgi:hypothetical protein